MKNACELFFNSIILSVSKQNVAPHSLKQYMLNDITEDAVSTTELRSATCDKCHRLWIRIYAERLATVPSYITLANVHTRSLILTYKTGTMNLYYLPFAVLKTK